MIGALSLRGALWSGAPGSVRRRERCGNVDGESLDEQWVGEWGWERAKPVADLLRRESAIETGVRSAPADVQRRVMDGDRTLADRRGL